MKERFASARLRLIRGFAACGLLLAAGHCRADAPASPAASGMVADQIRVLTDKQSSAADRIAAEGVLERAGGSAAPAIPVLIDEFEDADPEVREGASAALAHIGAASVPALIAAYEGRDEHVQDGVYETLATIGPPAIPYLSAALTGPGKGGHSLAGNLLERIGAPAVPALAAALRDPREDVRVNAALALGRIGAPSASAIPALIAALKHTDGGVVSATFALEQIGDPAIPPLIAALKNGDAHIRENAAAALGQVDVPWTSTVPWTPIVPALVAALKDPGPNVRSAAAGSLCQIALLLRLNPGRLSPAQRADVVRSFRAAVAAMRAMPGLSSNAATLTRFIHSRYAQTGGASGHQAPRATKR